MNARRSWWRRCTLVLLTLMISVVGWLGVAPAAQADESTKVLLLLDVSGSMNEKISSGGTKFAAAKKALKEVAAALPAGTQVGLRVYGSKIAAPKAQNPKACTDTDLVLPIGPLNQAKMNRAVDSFDAKGETPIAYSLEKSVADLGPSGKRVLVLISDGEETCSGDPCPTAKKLAKSGVDLQFNAIGLEVNTKARKQLQCIADAGDGNYYDAGNTSDLSDAVRKITQRALRPFQTNGTPVQGTVDRAGAPVVAAGLYRDSYDARGVARYYRVNRTPGSLVTASISSIVRPYPTQNGESWKLALTTADGTPCASNSVRSSAYHATSVVSGAVRSSNGGASSASPGGSPCETDPQLLLSLSRSTAFGSMTKLAPVEVVIAEEPPIGNLTSLPKGLSSYRGTGDAVAAKKPVKPVLGGTSFSNTAALAAGSWADSVATGETVFYRVPLQPGQRLRVTAQTPAPRTPWKLGSAEAITTRVTILSPARVKLTEQSANLQGAGAIDVTAASPEVRVRNRETPMPSNGNADDQLSTASVAGDYFVGLQIDPLGLDLTGRVMQIQLDVAVDGRPNGLPQYTEPSPTPSPTPSQSSVTPAASPTTGSSPDSGSSQDDGSGGVAPLGLAFGGGALLALLAVGALWWRRRPGQG